MLKVLIGGNLGFVNGNQRDGKHYWLTPPEILDPLQQEFNFDFDPCPFPKPAEFDGLACEWGKSNYVNPPFGAYVGTDGKKKGPTAWARKCIEENQKGKSVVLVYPIDKWVLMLLAAGAEVRNLKDVRWLATEDKSVGPGTGRHVACFILKGETVKNPQFDFGEKLRWNPAYFGMPGSGPEFKTCNTCAYMKHEVTDRGPEKNAEHFYFCAKVQEAAGLAKGIKKETAACSFFQAK